MFEDEQDATVSVEFVDKDALDTGTQIVNPETVSVNGILRFSALNIR